MAYKVLFTDGSFITVDAATRSVRDGSGVRLYDAEGGEVASFGDGEVRRAYPADSVETPAVTEGAPE